VKELMQQLTLLLAAVLVMCLTVTAAIYRSVYVPASQAQLAATSAPESHAISATAPSPPSEQALLPHPAFHYL